MRHYGGPQDLADPADDRPLMDFVILDGEKAKSRALGMSGTLPAWHR